MACIEDGLYEGGTVFVRKVLCAEHFKLELRLRETIVMRCQAGYKPAMVRRGAIGPVC